MGILRLKSADAADFVDLRYTNAESLITSATLNETGRAIADVYTLTLSAVVLGAPSTGTITVDTDDGSGKGPYEQVFTGVLLDNSTTRSDIVPGVDLKFSNSGSLANGWSSVVYVGFFAGILQAGNPLGTVEDWSSGVDDPGTTAGAAGDPGFVGKFLVVNTGAEAVANAQLVFRPRAVLVNRQTPFGFKSIEVVDDTPTERADPDGTIRPITFTFANLDAAASPDEIDVRMDEGSGAATFDVRNLDTATDLTSTQLLMDEATRYQIREAGAKLQGLVFTLASTATNGSEENVLAFNKRHVEFALDVAGTPGTWGTGPLTLTQSGESAGTIQPAGAVPVWIRWNVGALAKLNQSPFPGDLTAEYSLTGEADWLG
jgi:hypothetical protein